MATRQLQNDKDIPSHTSFEAQAICCTQEETDTSWGTVCHVKFALARLKDEEAPYSPQTFDEAWLNHFEAFSGQDLDRITLDHVDKSMLRTAKDQAANIEASIDKQFTPLLMCSQTGHAEVSQALLTRRPTLRPPPIRSSPRCRCPAMTATRRSHRHS